MYELLALDFGASSGRAICGCIENNKMRLTEVYRFSNDPVMLGNVFYWDFLRLFHEIKQSLAAAKQAGCQPESMSIDTWGVDVGFLDNCGYLLENPRHYRNTMGSGAKAAVLELIPADKLYRLTGLEFSEFNTIFQLFHLGRQNPELLKRAGCMLFLPDLFNYYLTGNKQCEYTIATTSQLLNIQTKKWDSEILRILGISSELFLPIVQPGGGIGTLLPSLEKELGLRLQVISTASHDTHAAFAAASLGQGMEIAVISCGTWSLIGRELDAPILNNLAFRHNFSNEGTIGGKYNLVKSITGLWVLQESRRQWEREGSSYSYSQLQEMARPAPSFACIMDLDATEFAAPGDMPGRIRDYARRSGQTPPDSVGGIVRAILESMAFKYRKCLEQQVEICGKAFGAVQIVGGGAQNTMLCSFTANATGVPVYGGPVEATAIGNLIMQAKSLGLVSSLDSGREMVRNSFPMKRYDPEQTEQWTAAYAKYLRTSFSQESDREKER